ncbi:hypothetical protein GQ55_1G062300 [Panicum hallii var. hallii]|uniref:Uncharacterized protein n=2 Tax=Panicum hallii TaxID=206008 RepID=A0A2T7F2U9_9POAL|nr:uncharacterized protein LOC112885112 [Panicum hallii]PAN04391.1 hypothetical protein PAHAL_1G064100 [Panicum hallii]PUZ74398.1 hypothetical protein GQ55_1G062300 [Panicum hallii var. hallii]
MSSSPPPCSKAAAAGSPAGKYCLCAPTTHPGSFRCRLHRSPVEAKATAAAATSGADQEAATAAAAAVARELLERMARKPRRQGVVPGAFRPGPSRLGATATAMDD